MAAPISSDGVVGLVGISVDSSFNTETKPPAALERRNGDHAITKVTTAANFFRTCNRDYTTVSTIGLIQSRAMREQVRGFIEEMIRGELDAALDRPVNTKFESVFND